MYGLEVEREVCYMHTLGHADEKTKQIASGCSALLENAGWNGRPDQLQLAKFSNSQRRSNFPHLFPKRFCKIMKADNISPDPNRQPHTLESDQEKVVPPHCKARKKLEKEAVSKIVPPRSTLANFSLSDRAEANGVGRGGVRNAAIRSQETKPMAM